MKPRTNKILRRYNFGNWRLRSCNHLLKWIRKTGKPKKVLKLVRNKERKSKEKLWLKSLKKR